jgi:dephospho-CoA kinase
MSARLTIGLTGDVGSGKSTVRAWLGERGVATFDGDAAVHAVLAEDRAVIAAVVARFGPEVGSADGIRRAILADRVFTDAAALGDLERLVHPAVLERTRAWLEAVTAPVAVVEGVKLVESGFHRALDRLWLAVCDLGLRRQRLIARGWSAGEVERRLAMATPLAPKLALADEVIDNSGSCRATRRQLEAAWSRLVVDPRLGPGGPAGQTEEKA